MEIPDKAFPLIRISSLEELFRLEPEILARIERTPNGGNLFLIHPFLLLADIGVELSDTARQEIVHNQPEISGLSPIPYQALTNSRAPQTVRYRLKGLFRRGMP